MSGSLGHHSERLGWQHCCGHGNANDEKQALRGTAISGTGLLGGQRKTVVLENICPAWRRKESTNQVWQPTSAVSGYTLSYQRVNAFSLLSKPGTNLIHVFRQSLSNTPQEPRFNTSLGSSRLSCSHKVCWFLLLEATPRHFISTSCP